MSNAAGSASGAAGQAEASGSGSQSAAAAAAAPTAATTSSTTAAQESSAAPDPLANVITQVSANAPPVSGRYSGPARPTRVAKQGAGKGDKKKKARATEPLAESSKSAAAATTDGSAGADAAESSTAAAATTGTAASAGPTADGDAGTSAANRAEQLTAEDAALQTHSQKPSSTLVGTTRSGISDGTAGDGADVPVGLTQDKPTDPAMTPTEPDPTVNPALTSGSAIASQQEMTRAAKQLKSGGTATSPKRQPVIPPRASGKARAQERSSESQATTAAPGKQKKPSLAKKILAILTCSAFGAAAEEEGRSGKDNIEMSEKRRQQRSQAKGRESQTQDRPSPKGESGGLDVPASMVQGSRSPSRRASFDKTPSVGRGTRLPREETGDVMSGAVVPPGSTFVVPDPAVKGSSASQKGGEDEDADAEKSDDEDWMGDEQLEDDEEQTEEQRLIHQGGAGIPRDADGNLQPLLGPIIALDHGRKCLVLDLDETLVHSSFKMIPNADFIVPVEIEGTVHNVYVIKRPGVDEFMRRMGEVYEVVVFTASLSKYADPVLDILDIHRVVRHRLFRESCYNHRGNYVKDLSQLGRDIEHSIIIDNSPASYIFHPNNAVPISSWFNDPHDTELTDLCPFLAELAEVQDVRAVLDAGL